MRLRHDVVLVALTPAQERTRSGILLSQTLAPMATSGRVLRTGPQCLDVAPGDTVAFPPNAGAVEWQIGAHRCLLLREIDISAIVAQENTPA